MSSDPKVWGASAWKLMESIAATFDPHDAFRFQKTKDFYESLAGSLPCHTCSSTYRSLLQKYPVQEYMTSSQRLSEWVSMIHDKVNHHIATHASHTSSLATQSTRRKHTTKESSNAKDRLAHALKSFRRQ